MYSREWLNSLKEGDKVVVRYGRGIGSARRVHTIERTTKTQIIVNNAKYRRLDGYEIGGSYHSPYLIEATPDVLQEMEEETRRWNVLRKVQQITWKDLPTSVLESVYEIIPAEMRADK